jgi:hypothetical protein
MDGLKEEVERLQQNVGELIALLGAVEVELAEKKEQLSISESWRNKYRSRWELACEYLRRIADGNGSREEMRGLAQKFLTDKKGVVAG